MKKGILPLVFLISLPMVLAEGIITEGFQFLFGQSSNVIVLKLGILIVLIAIFKAGLLKMKLFPEHPNMAVLVAAVLGLIAIKFMPTEISAGIGSLIWVGALFVLPYTLFGMFIESKFWKIVLTLVSVVFIYFLTSGFGWFGYGGTIYSRYPYLGFIRGSEIFDDIYYHLSFKWAKWLIPALLIAGIIFLIYYLSKGREGKGFFERRHERKMARIQAGQPGIFRSMGSALGRGAGKLLDTGKDLVGGTLGAGKELAGGVLGTGKDMGKGAWDAVKAATAARWAHEKEMDKRRLELGKQREDEERRRNAAAAMQEGRKQLHELDTRLRRLSRQGIPPEDTPEFRDGERIIDQMKEVENNYDFDHTLSDGWEDKWSEGAKKAAAARAQKAAAMEQAKQQVEELKEKLDDIKDDYEGVPAKGTEAYKVGRDVIKKIIKLEKEYDLDDKVGDDLMDEWKKEGADRAQREKALKAAEAKREKDLKELEKLENDLNGMIDDEGYPIHDDDKYLKKGDKIIEEMEDIEKEHEGEEGFDRSPEAKKRWEAAKQKATTRRALKTEEQRKAEGQQKLEELKNELDGMINDEGYPLEDKEVGDKIIEEMERIEKEYLKGEDDSISKESRKKWDEAHELEAKRRKREAAALEKRKEELRDQLKDYDKRLRKIVKKNDQVFPTEGELRQEADTLIDKIKINEDELREGDDLSRQWELLRRDAGTKIGYKFKTWAELDKERQEREETRKKQEIEEKRLARRAEKARERPAISARRQRKLKKLVDKVYEIGEEKDKIRVPGRGAGVPAEGTKEYKKWIKLERKQTATINKIEKLARDEIGPKRKYKNVRQFILANR